MNKTIFPVLIILASIFIVAAFFMPWARVATSVTGVSKELTGSVSKTPIAGKVVGDLTRVTDAISAFGDIEIKTTVRGYKIPAMVNSDTSKVALSLAQILFKGAEGIDKKSYLVYLSPILAILCGLLAALGIKSRIYVLILIIISGVISTAGLYNLYTMDVNSMAVKITIAKGLWYTMYSFLLMFLAGIAWQVLDWKKA
ncbi:MAG: hypothetical protein U9R44_06690 [Candidatus Omnitrophota bacterium]|nr:hypothetical protein [Candidatus Omnitrophota bacterium]